MRMPLLLLFVLFTPLFMDAQIPGTSEVSIISPKAASILRYGQHPVSLYTGLVDISVPIYTVTGRGISLPISLKYHASGIKFDDVSGEVGLGWSLIAGGAINQNYMGAQDNLYSEFPRDVNNFKVCDNDPSNLSNEYNTLRYVYNGSLGNNHSGPSSDRRDGEIDMYSFSFLNHSGSFCFPFLDSEVEQGTPRPNTGTFIPATGMKVISRTGQSIVILDTDGISYHFELKDSDNNSSNREYYLTQITSADGGDVINLTYEVMTSSVNAMQKPFINYTASVTTTTRLDASVGEGYPASETTSSDFGGVYYQSLRPPRLTRIDFTGGYVTFHYKTVNNVLTWDLQQIKVFNNVQASIPIQVVSLEKSLFGNGEQRLDKVTFSESEAGTGKSYDYRFGYNGEPGSVSGNFGNRGIDYWGYFNGQNVPGGRRFHPIISNTHSMLYSGTNRNANALRAQDGILNKITYPTKGYSEFTYEGHQGRYSSTAPLENCGGVRIKEIRSYSATGALAEKKSYKYGQNESGYGTVNTSINPFDFTSQTTSLITRWFSSTETASNHLCRKRTTTTYSTFPKVSYFISGSSVVYDWVTEYLGNETETYGKTVYRYEVRQDERMYSQGYTYRLYAPSIYARTYSWNTGKLISEEVFRKVGGSFQLVQQVSNTYKDINKGEFRNIRVSRRVLFETDNKPGGYTGENYESTFCTRPEYRQQFEGYNMTPYDYYNYYTTTGYRVLTSTTEMTDGVSVVTNFDTHNDIGLPTSITTSYSIGALVTTVLKYPTDFDYSPYTDMQTKNMLTPVIEKTTLKNGLPIKKEKTGYGFWSPGFFAPSSYGEAFGYDNPVTRATFNYDGKRNLREISRVGDIKDVYLWGYSNRHPIAVLKGTTYDNVAGILGQALIDRVANAITPAPADLTAINNLRTSLPVANIMTYTYQPLIGLTSQTDGNGFKTHFEYDGFGRLKLTKDNSGNILQVYDYQYKK